MSVNSGGYPTEIEYTGDFFPHLAPAWMRYIATTNGCEAPSIEGRFTACDLGCGKGVSTLILAANHPSGEFHGCDISAPHIAFADRVKSRSGIANAHFHASSFGELLEADLPPFDFITLHGVYSWVPPAVREEVHALIRKCLAPNGLVMVSYNAQPGWAPIQPLRVLLRETARRQTGDSAERVRKALVYLQAMAREGAGYFAASPAAARQVARIAADDVRYVIHEYLAEQGDPFHFQEVATAMRGVGLEYAGSMTARDNDTQWALPANFARLLDADAPVDAVEMHRDFVRNTTFRRDLYAARATGCRAPPTLAAMSGITFALTNLPSALPLSRAEGAVRYDLGADAEAVRRIHATLARGSATARALHDESLASREDDTASLIARMVIADHIAPAPAAPLAGGWQRVNSELIDAGLAGNAPRIALACPRTGLATYVETVLCAIIETAARCADADAAAREVLRRVRSHAHPASHAGNDGLRAATDGEILESAASVWRALSDRTNPQRRALELFGVL